MNWCQTLLELHISFGVSWYAGLLDQPLVVEGKRSRKSTETFAVKHEAKRPATKVVYLLPYCKYISSYLFVFFYDYPYCSMREGQGPDLVKLQEVSEVLPAVVDH